MRYTIVKNDQAVYENGVAILGVDLSDLPSDFHALQWDDEAKIGEIEWKTVTTPNQPVSVESEIDSAMGITLSKIKELRSQRIVQIEEEVTEALRVRNAEIFRINEVLEAEAEARRAKAQENNKDEDFVV